MVRQCSPGDVVTISGVYLAVKKIDLPKVIHKCVVINFVRYRLSIKAIVQ